MSDLSIYELEDIIWDDFDHSGDHIVPHPTDNQGSEDKCEGDIGKKPRLDVTPIQSNEERGLTTLNKETATMEKDSWSNMLDNVFAASGDTDSSKDTPAVKSGDAKLTNRCFESSNINSGSGLCTSEDILKDSSGAVDRTSYNDLNLFSNDYGWPDVGYFEDVDRMLSNCDSSFGLGVTGNDDELVWFTSEDPGRGFAETLKMDLELPCSEPSALTNVSLSHDHEPQESENRTSSSVSESKDELKEKDQNLTEGLITSHCLESFGLKNNETRTSSDDNWQQSRNLGHDSVDYMQSIGYLPQGHDHDPMQSTGGSSGIKSESKAPSEVFSQPASSLSTESDEISLEATTFRQLQQAMLQLDLRTKLCIRDSLYRLARSAEQRHNYAGGINGGTANNGGTGGSLVTEGTSKYTGLMDMETDTNPIDRTVAHLLFHRPSDSSNMPTSLVYGSRTGPVMMTKKPSCQQVETESDDKTSSTRKN